MAAYKVPQDVEAEDKLIGPFSFRQFIYLIVAALGIFTAWLLSQIFIGLLILPLPIVIAFLALALPLRKDQPMETYLIAMIKFFFKPRNRLWDPEGTISLVQITAPKTVEGPQIKSLGGAEASQRLAYLAQVVDTQGWSTRGAVSANDSLSDIFLAEATHAEDILDETSGVAQSFEQKMTQSEDARLSAVRKQMQTQAPAIQLPASNSTQPIAPTAPSATDEPDGIHYNPYPDSMHQRVIQPASTQPQNSQPAVAQPQAQNKPSSETISPDIMRLANNNDLSISAIAREAHRLKNEDNNEVVVSLR